MSLAPFPDLNRFDRGLRESLLDFNAVLTVCLEANHHLIKPSHFLVALTRIKNGFTQKLFEAKGEGLRPETVIEVIMEEISSGESPPPLEIAFSAEYFSAETLEMFAELEQLANRGVLSQVTEKTLLYAVLRHLEPQVRHLFEGVLDLAAIIDHLTPGQEAAAARLEIFDPESGLLRESALDDSGRAVWQLLPAILARTGFHQVRPEHLGMALARLEKGITAKGLLLQLKKPALLYESLESRIRRSSAPGAERELGHRDAFTPSSLRVLERAGAIAGEDGWPHVGESQLLRALLELESEGILGNTLKALGVNLRNLMEFAKENKISKAAPPEEGNPWEKLRSRWSELEPFLRGRIIGQEEAIERVLAKLSIAIVNVRPENQPVGGLFFAGPTGVGKTELARTLAEFVFGTPEALIRFDMSEYMEAHAVAKLIGAPPGYVGYGEGGQLTRRIQQQPFAIILFDEIEKAHREIYPIFLQIFDHGCLTDSLGRKVSFHNTLIILTSNIGAALAETAATEERRRQIYLEAFEREFPPEFRGRLSDVIFFNSLSKENCRKILEFHLQKLKDDFLRKTNLSVIISEKTQTFLLESGFDSRLGARHLHRVIDNCIRAPLSKALLEGRVQPGDQIVL